MRAWQAELRAGRIRTFDEVRCYHWSLISCKTLTSETIKMYDEHVENCSEHWRAFGLPNTVEHRRWCLSSDSKVRTSESEILKLRTLQVTIGDPKEAGTESVSFHYYEIQNPNASHANKMVKRNFSLEVAVRGWLSGRYLADIWQILSAQVNSAQVSQLKTRSSQILPHKNSSRCEREDESSLSPTNQAESFLNWINCVSSSSSSSLSSLKYFGLKIRRCWLKQTFWSKRFVAILKRRTSLVAACYRSLRMTFWLKSFEILEDHLHCSKPAAWSSSESSLLN